MESKQKQPDALRDTNPICVDWTKREWPGNRAMNLDARVKTFKGKGNKSHVKTQVWVFGKDGSYTFCVAAGANSQYAYSGTVVYDKPITIEEYCKLVDKRHEIDKLIV